MNEKGINGYISAEIVPSGFVYFITDGDVIKIGYSICPRDRLRGLQTSNHKGLWIIDFAPGTTGDEGRLHRRFSETRLSGEWFQSSPELLALISDFCCARTKTEAVRRDLATWASNKGVPLNRLIRLIDGCLKSLAHDPDQPRLRQTVIMSIGDLRRAADGLRSAA